MPRPIIRILSIVPITLALAVTVVSQAPVPPKQRYTLTLLPLLLPGETSDGAAYAINNSGQIVGDSAVSTTLGIAHHAVLWDQGTVTDLGTLGGKNSTAFGINDLGQIVGESDIPSGATHAFLYEKGVMTDLGVTAQDSHARAINNGGVVTGYSLFNSAPSAVWVWERGTTTFLPALPFPGANAISFGINEPKAIVGASNTAVDTHAVLWQGGVPMDLGTFGGTSLALAVNNRTQVVGGSELSLGQSAHAFLWQSGTMLDLHSIGIASVGDGINDVGQVVGQLVLSDGCSHPFLWQAGSMTDLNTLLTGSSPMNGYARAINNRGQILGDKFEPESACGSPDIELPVVLNPVNGAGQD